MNNATGEPRSRPVFGCLASTAIFLAIIAACELLARSLLGHVLAPTPFEADFIAGKAPPQIELEPTPGLVTDRHGFLVANPALPGLNADGFRTPRFDEAALGRPTVLFLGDSFTWGASADPLENAFVDRVRAEGFRTINLGIPATSPVQYAALARRYVEALKPDAVCVMFYPLNDFQIEGPVRPGIPRRYETNAGMLLAMDEHGEPLGLDQAFDRYYRHYFPRTIRERIEKVVRNSGLALAAVAISRGEESREGEIEKALADLTEIQQICQANAAIFKLFILPVRHKFRTESHNEQTSALDLAPLSPEIPTDFTDADFAGENDEHYNNAGHERMANFIVHSLKRSGCSPAISENTSAWQETDIASAASFDEFCAALELPIEARQRTRSVLVHLKEQAAELYFTPIQEGGASPGERFTGAWAKGEATWPDGLSALLSTLRPRGAETTYEEQLEQLTKEAVEALSGEIPAPALQKLSSLPPQVLATVVTGHVPIQRHLERAAFRRSARSLGLDDASLGRRVRDDRAASVGVRLDQRGRLAWEDAVRVLALDAQEAAAMNSQITQLANRYLEIVCRAAENGAPSPMDMLAARLAAEAESGASVAGVFDAFLKTNHPESATETYQDLIEQESRAVWDTVEAQLRTASKSLDILPIFTLLEIDIAADGFDQELQKRVKLIQQRQREVDNPDTPNSWAGFRRALALDDAQAVEVTAILDKFKDARHALMTSPPANGGLSPWELARTLDGAPDAAARVAEYAQSTPEPRSGKTYTEALFALEVEARKAVYSVLRATQYPAFETAAQGSFADINTGHDPAKPQQ